MSAKSVIDAPLAPASRFQRSSQATCLAVMYHYVRDPSPTARGGIKAPTRKSFAAQLDALCRQLEPICWLDLWRWLQGEGEIPHRSFMLTFDDGLKEHLEVVAPELESRGLSGVFFVATQTLFDRRPLSAHLLHALLDQMDVGELTTQLTSGLTHDHPTPCGLNRTQSGDADMIYHYESTPTRYVKYWINYVLPPTERYTILEDLYVQNVGSIDDFVRQWYLDPDDAADLHRRGHTVGGHGHRHEPLTTIGPAEQFADMRRCFDLLEPMIRQPAIPLSFPYGSFDADTLERCQAAGFSAAFSTEPSPIRFSSDCFRLPRIDTIDVNKHLRNGS